MALDIPLPTEAPNIDPPQYIPLLLSAIGEFLQARDVWLASEYDAAYDYMEELKLFVVDLFTRGEIMPIGKIDIWLADIPPDGFVMLDGHAISRTVYAELFALWGTLYGPGDGTTTFNVPNFNDRLPIGSGTLVDMGEEAGSWNVTINRDNLPDISFPVTDPGHTHSYTTPATSGGDRVVNSGGARLLNATATTGSQQTGISVRTGGSGHYLDILNPVLGVKFIAWTGVVTPP